MKAKTPTPLNLVEEAVSAEQSWDSSQPKKNYKRLGVNVVIGFEENKKT